MQWRKRDGVRWLEAELSSGATACFSTRVGGVSSAPFDALNLGLLTGDEALAVRENRGRLTAALGRDADGVLFGHQVHETQVASRDRAPAPNPWLADARPDPADGQATSDPTLTPLVQVADCLPVALAGPGGVAMLHCGWRGLAGGIVADGVASVEAVAAAIGPGIGPCCYEVGDDVLTEFESLGGEIADGRMLDLPEVARRLLARAGVDHVESSDLCTSCEAQLFYSHRRDGERTGRQAGLAWLAADA
jgi:YfiH family protein